MKTFQQPLAKKDEDYYLERLGDEDEERKLEAKQVLIERNLRLVAHIAKKYQGTEVEMEDLISIGTVGLIKAVMSYDLDKNSKLGTYAARCIENEILMHFRARKKCSREVSIYEPIGTDREGNEINLLDIIEADQLDTADQMQLHQDLKKMLASIDVVLDEREKEIVCMRFGLRGYKELTQKEIGEKLHISRSYISRIEKKALQKLRVALTKE
ncbi:MAG: RNA polymerase sporulation sigma factor SigK [Lachnospiraceae bacterium]|nr:RNA polymerase sporulation sigma factor SigK [Lachnospiraceae bacterium]